MELGKVKWKEIDWPVFEREYAETLGPSLTDAEHQRLANATLEPLRECLRPLSSEPDDLPTTNLSSFVADLAARHGVADTRTPVAEWGNPVAKVLGDFLEFDDTERLLLGLKSAGVIDGRQAARLIANHLRDRKAVGN